MRKNTTECLNAFTTGTEYHGPQDTIRTIGSGVVTWELHGNVIARRVTNYGTGEETLFLSTCGWNTNTTWDRLRAIAGYYGLTLDRKTFTSETFILNKGATK